jgi:hypothetical protein
MKSANSQQEAIPRNIFHDVEGLVEVFVPPGPTFMQLARSLSGGGAWVKSLRPEAVGGSPVARAGVQKGWHIIHQNEIDMRSMQFEQITLLLRKHGKRNRVIAFAPHSHADASADATAVAHFMIKNTHGPKDRKVEKKVLLGDGGRKTKSIVPYFELRNDAPDNTSMTKEDSGHILSSSSEEADLEEEDGPDGVVYLVDKSSGEVYNDDENAEELGDLRPAVGLQWDNQRKQIVHATAQIQGLQFEHETIL